MQRDRSMRRQRAVKSGQGKIEGLCSDRGVLVHGAKPKMSDSGINYI